MSTESHDLANELLLGMRLLGVQYKRIELAAPFGIGFISIPGRAQFHFVSRGQALLRTGNGNIYSLNTGDALLLPQGVDHVLLSSPDVACKDIRTFVGTPVCANVCCVKACPLEPQMPTTLIFSGCMEFDLGGMQMLVSAMPEVLLADTLMRQHPEVQPMLEAMERESLARRAGYAGILSRLADVVAALIVRAWVESGCGNTSGWLQALRDPRLGKALVALHREPGKNWTVAQLAAEMGSSRSVFAERFLAVTGMPPLRYLTELRMQLAMQWIGRDGEAIETVAWRLGYGSLAAFSRAFKRITGTTPGTLKPRMRSRYVTMP
ncbi:AraC family transcriptional regulator [Erwinia endophytica]|uniref:AraC family transcriptional regulator n=1 Tax=Erwinia endophytica TaxID=1563158 RepID=UPI001265FB57|nr:AraC family transcriptional regulator [Erwinia endophytica]KAB8312853.1 AraC family transcriptional regulator [Erwinia endophytica]